MRESYNREKMIAKSWAEDDEKRKQHYRENEWDIILWTVVSIVALWASIGSMIFLT